MNLKQKINLLEKLKEERNTKEQKLRFGVKPRWNGNTVSDAGTFFDETEDALASEFLPSLFGVDEGVTCKYSELAEL